MTDKLAISVATVGMWQGDGSPMATVQSAVCDVCGGWATSLRVSGQRKKSAGDDLFNQRTSRRVIVIAYACEDHDDQVSDSLMDEFEWSTNRWDGDALADEVDRRSRIAWSSRSTESTPAQ